MTRSVPVFIRLAAVCVSLSTTLAATTSLAFDNRSNPALPTIELNLDVLDKYREPGAPKLVVEEKDVAQPATIAPIAAPQAAGADMQDTGQPLQWIEGPKGQIINKNEPKFVKNKKPAPEKSKAKKPTPIKKATEPKHEPAIEEQPAPASIPAAAPVTEPVVHEPSPAEQTQSVQKKGEKEDNGKQQQPAAKETTPIAEPVPAAPKASVETTQETAPVETPTTEVILPTPAPETPEVAPPEPPAAPKMPALPEATKPVAPETENALEKALITPPAAPDRMEDAVQADAPTSSPDTDTPAIPAPTATPEAPVPVDTAPSQEIPAIPTPPTPTNLKTVDKPSLPPLPDLPPPPDADAKPVEILPPVAPTAEEVKLPVPPTPPSPPAPSTSQPVDIVAPPAPPAEETPEEKQAPDALPPTGDQPAADMSIAFKSTETAVPLTIKPQLEELAKKINADEKLRVNLVSYASNTNDQASTARRVSLSRALAVRAFLIEQGVANLRINVQAQGDKNPGGEPDRVDIFLDNNSGK